MDEICKTIVDYYQVEISCCTIIKLLGDGVLLLIVAISLGHLWAGEGDQLKIFLQILTQV